MFSHMECRHNPHPHPNHPCGESLFAFSGAYVYRDYHHCPDATQKLSATQSSLSQPASRINRVWGGGGVFPTRLSRQTRTNPVPYGVPWFIQPGKGTGAADSQRIPDFSPSSVMLLLGVAMCFVYASISIFIIYTVY